MSCDCNTLVVGQAGPQGPQGLPGINGVIGQNGVNAFTTLTASFVQPSVGASATFFVVENSWIAIGQSLYIQQAGTYTVSLTASSSVKSVTATLISTDGVASGSTVASGKKVTPTAIATFSGTVPSLTVITGGTSNLDGPVVINGSGNNSDFRVEGTGFEHLLFCDANAGGSGRVGIATATPETILHVFGDFKVGTSITPANCEITGDASVGGDFIVDTSSLVVDATNNRVGIGSITPTVALDVVGAIAATGALSGASATVTGNLTVDTTTLVVNATNNRVGIGSATPTVALDVVGAIAATTGTFTGALSGASATVTGDLVVDTSSLVVDATNNRVGIGTLAPTSALEVVGAVKFGGDLTVDTNTLVVNAANNRVGIGSASPTVALDVAGAIAATTGTFTGALSGTTGTFSGAVSGDSATVTGNLTVDTNTLVVNATNNRVGIGSASPTVALDVVGTVKFGGDLTVDTNTLVVDATNARVGIGIGSPTVALDVVGAGKFSGALTVDTNTLVVDATNNRVGIGSATPTVVLDVAGAITATGAFSGTTGAFTGNLTVDTNVLFVDTGVNRVGINTSTFTAGYSLEVIGNIKATDVDVTNAFSAPTLSVNPSGTPNANIFQVRGSSVSIYPITVKGVTAGGVVNAVGIYNSDPSFPLDVTGDIRIATGALKRKAVTETSTSVSIDAEKTFINMTTTGNSAVSVTLPAASSTVSGREIYIRATVLNAAVNSASSNVSQLGGSVTNAIIASPAAGKWVMLVCDGSNWNIMAASA
jgi:hypothetical protein